MGGYQSRKKMLILHIFGPKMVFFRTLTVPRKKSVRFTSMKLIISIIACFNLIILIHCFEKKSQLSLWKDKKHIICRKHRGVNYFSSLFHQFYILRLFFFKQPFKNFNLKILLVKYTSFLAWRRLIFARGAFKVCQNAFFLSK